VSVTSCHCMVLWDCGYLEEQGSGLSGCDAVGRVFSSVSKHNAFIFRVKQSKKSGHAPTKNQNATEGQRPG
jgi:hypothetical protein